MKVKIEFISGNGKVYDLDKISFIGRTQDNEKNGFIGSILWHELMDQTGRKIINWNAVESIREWKIDGDNA